MPYRGAKKETTGNSYRYIESYAKEAGLNPVMACLQVLNETEKVLNSSCKRPTMKLLRR
jgi:hypothetical protein